MPMLVMNMGGEMVYILQQRLQAQQVPPEKKTKVLQDVVRTMYSTSFISELFKPQPMYTNTATKQIFDKLAHSSIMKLNESSMEKLYDLMTMGVKYQVLLCNQPEQLLQVTLNHLEALKVVVESPVVLSLVESAAEMAVETYGRLSAGDWIMLRQQLLAFFKGRKIKVSLFLKTGIQRLDGTVVLNCAGPVPMGGEVPGTIRYFRDGDLVDTQAFESKAAERGALPCPSSIFEASSSLGGNLYAEGDHARAQAQVMQSDAAKAAAKAIGQRRTALPKRRGGPGGDRGGDYKAQAKTNITAELNLLANLLGTAVKEVDGEAKKSDLKPFKINLFPNDVDDSADGKEDGVRTIILDSASDRKTALDMMKELDLEDEGKDEKKGAKDDDDDLLALMDSAAK
eukprot:CAMPEP_0113936056 /NCGR_PEP_ID=MMETSP1339-20121228/3047_1 /TAXON_ID=94617 /ORGANISM="Fibrocapsa japonica" /LENGTH=397 /DNA_ID=CAMNT_0000938393 /DNA_START=126 /DNA_END=1319 /DNA_ORIENTATION=- /assembly_acc=CAM_ASM_000762